MNEPVIKTLLFTDLVDSTSLVALLGDVQASRLFKRHDDIARSLLDEYRGQEIDKSDGFLLLFSRPLDAARYSLAFHDALAVLAEEMDVQLAARVGIHLGEVVLRENAPEFVARGAKPIEVEGLAKPIAARLMSLAQGAQTLMTRAAFDLARRAAVVHPAMADVKWLNHGPYRFKGIDATLSVFETGRVGRAPLAAPVNSEKAWRAVGPLTDGDAAWRPAPALYVPGQGEWKLVKKIGDGRGGELWLAREDVVGPEAVTTESDAGECSGWQLKSRAYLFSRTFEGASVNGPAAWQLSDAQAFLVITSGEQRGTFIRLAGNPLTFGRAASVDFKLDDGRVSRRHFEVSRTTEGYSIHELQTTNGVFVNGERTSKQLLENQDTIHVGSTDLVFYGHPHD